MSADNMLAIKKPAVLRKGDTIALIAPSAGLAAVFPHRLDAAISFLKREGYSVKEFATTRTIAGWESGSAEARTRDIMNAFTDTKIKAIISVIGGNTANKVLELLDYKVIQANPKIFCGYSDISVLHYALYTCAHLVTFYGPCAMTQFGEFPQPLLYTREYFYKAVASTESMGVIPAALEWTDETLDWGKKEDQTRPRALKPNKKYRWLRLGKARGFMLGGCLPSIMHLVGTSYAPSYHGAILFLDIPEGSSFDKGEPLHEVDAFLADLRNQGVFRQIVGLIVGRPFGYTTDEDKKFQDLLQEHTRGYTFPILYGADIGHTDPQMTIPLGVAAELDAAQHRFAIIESGVV